LIIILSLKSSYNQVIVEVSKIILRVQKQKVR